MCRLQVAASALSEQIIESAMALVEAATLEQTRALIETLLTGIAESPGCVDATPYMQVPCLP